ncbi:type II toxin-antitoxin system prevent-host-death family antitoxin [Umezawaea sp. Da 62-37]|uniref:type II toxin-antitoxin system prevent-host-death family antitoxin n=1 Tax=Umezawaea sp. Da 62-37 TaxID=3075927 RepID=UPI0028F74F0C|nr:type II toxin-antitoxin system prevent-host-death family antitoxin [Umezawaea sp. Da 62-37]WNV84024.1 type II toxin-antitoxin system prevent-host-death family antitoxin [Umezawaea sp. Da 62-37]
MSHARSSESHGEIDVPLSDARGALPQLLDEHVREGEVVFLTRHGRRVGALVSADVAEHLGEMEDAYWSARAAQAKREMEASGEQPIPWAQALAILEAADSDEVPGGNR